MWHIQVLQLTPMTLEVVTKSSFLRFDDAFISQENWIENERKPRKRRKTPICWTNDSMHLRCVMYWIFRWFLFVRKFVRISCFRYMWSFSKRMVFFELKCDVFEILFAMHRTCCRLSANNFKYLDSECSFYRHTFRSTCFCLSDYLICSWNRSG